MPCQPEGPGVRPPESAGPGLNIQGVLGEDFLEQFDMLIDNAHGLLCLDDTSAMRTDVKGQHVALLAPTTARNGAPLPKSLIVSVRFPTECGRFA